MPRSITPFLMFEGNAGKAIELYISLFPNSKIVSIEHYKAGEHGAEGTVKLATISLAGQNVMCIDSPAKHAFTFTPASSLFVVCEEEAELDRAFATLSDSGQVLMPPANYGFSTKFAWINDRFGVSWQLNLV